MNFNGRILNGSVVMLFVAFVVMSSSTTGALAKKRSKKNPTNHFSLQLKVKSSQIEGTLNSAKKLLDYGKKEKM